MLRLSGFEPSSLWVSLFIIPVSHSLLLYANGMAFLKKTYEISALYKAVTLRPTSGQREILTYSFILS